MDPTTTELLKQCDTVEDFAAQIDALAARLPKAAVRLGTNVVRVEPSGGGWRVETGEGRSDRFDALILATPSHVAAGLLKPVAAELSGDLAGIEHEGTAIVTMAFEAACTRP